MKSALFVLFVTSSAAALLLRRLGAVLRPALSVRIRAGRGTKVYEHHVRADLYDIFQRDKQIVVLENAEPFSGDDDAENVRLGERKNNIARSAQIFSVRNVYHELTAKFGKRCFHRRLFPFDVAERHTTIICGKREKGDKADGSCISRYNFNVQRNIYFTKRFQYCNAFIFNLQAVQ